MYYLVWRLTLTQPLTVPTETQNLYDIILAIRRKRPNATPGYRLKDLSVELPASDGRDAPDARGNIREPLLPKAGYTGPGVRMTRNLRFVPTLYNDFDTGGKPVLGVKLIPRSAQPDATIVLTNDGRTTEASVLLAQCPIAKLVDQFKGVLVAQVNEQGQGTGRSAREPRGICKVVLKETYVLSDGTERTMTTDGEVRPGPDAGIPLWVLKAARGDVDIVGNPV
jgi:hypothetical protein